MDKVTTEVSRAHRMRARLAAGYANQGWYVLPTRRKVPTIKAWETEATADPDEALAAWDSRGEWAGTNIGIACGPSGLVVFDLDTKGDHNGVHAFERLLQRLGVPPPDTYVVRTPSGGLHYYFAAPPGVEIRLSASQVDKGVDIRAWGGLVVAAGSEIDGRPYSVVNGRDPAPLPMELVEYLLRMPTSRSRAGTAERIPEVIAQGERESVLVSLAGTMRRRGASVEAIYAALAVENDLRCVPPITEDDLDRISKSIGRYDPEDPDLDPMDVGPDPDLVRKWVIEQESKDEAQRIVRTRRDVANREILGGMAEPMSAVDFINSGPNPIDTCLWGQPVLNGVMAWAESQGTIIAGPPGTGKSTIALQLVLRRCGLLSGDVLGMPVTSVGDTTIYLALDRADQIRQSLRRMMPDDPDLEGNARFQLINALPPSIEIRDARTVIGWLKSYRAGCVVIDSAKDLGFELSDSSEGMAFNHLMQALLRAGLQVLVTHHSRKIPRGDRKPLTLNDLHGSQWIAAGAGSVLMLDGDAGPTNKRIFHVKPLTVPVPALEIELDTDTGEIGHKDYVEAEGRAERANSADQILELLTAEAPLTGNAIAKELGIAPSTASRALGRLAIGGLVIRLPEDKGWGLA